MNRFALLVRLAASFATAVLLASSIVAAPLAAQETISAEELAKIRAAEAARVAAIDKVYGSVVAIFGNDRGGGGSGVLYDPAGYALTNYHVVAGAGVEGWAGLADGKLYRWKLIGLDPGGDVAIIKLSGKDNFPTAALGNSDTVRVGDFAMAMGNPFVLAEDLRPTVTLGIVSGIKRYQPGEGGATMLVYGNCIQVDSSINPGNSGGPLFNLDSEVVGINGRGSFKERGRVNVGVGYAISMEQIKNFIPELLATKTALHGTLDATFAARDGRVICERINLDSKIAELGLSLGDRLVSFDGQSVDDVNQYTNHISTIPAGWPVEVVFEHEGRERAVWLRLPDLPYPKQKQPPAQKPGDKKPDDKKPEEKKPEESKPEEKKPEEKKSDDKQPASKPQEGKSQEGKPDDGKTDDDNDSPFGEPVQPAKKSDAPQAPEPSASGPKAPEPISPPEEPKDAKRADGPGAPSPQPKLPDPRKRDPRQPMPPQGPQPQLPQTEPGKIRDMALNQGEYRRLAAALAGHIGGRATIDAAKAIESREEILRGGQRAGEASLLVAADGRFRAVYTVDNQSHAAGFDGKIYWTQTGASPAAAVAAKELVVDPLFASALVMGRMLKADGLSSDLAHYELQGSDRAQRMRSYRLRASLTKEDDVFVWLSLFDENGAPQVRLLKTAIGAGGTEIDPAVTYHDEREVAGLKMPHRRRVVEGLAERQKLDLISQGAKAVADLPADAFSMPSANK